MARWLGSCPDLRLEEGVRFTLRQTARPGWPGVVDCEVVHVDPGRTLAFRWTAPDLAAPTTARLSVIRTHGGSRLEVTHDGFRPSGLPRKLLHVLGWQKALVFDLPKVLKAP